MIHTAVKILKMLGIYDSIRKFIFSNTARLYRIRKRAQSLFCKRKAIIPLYHRIANVSNDPTLLCVSPEIFEEHLKFYKENYTILTLESLLEKIKTKNLTGGELTLTFDDGYRDNLINALPLLEKYNIPATIFVTTGNLGNVANFEWDKHYNPKDRAHFLSPEEIRILSKHPLITIGAHTENHIKLSTATDDTVLDELKTSKKKLESIINKEVDFFAYPFGGPLDFTKRTEVLTQRTRYKAAIANTQIFVTNRSRITAIPRINIRNYTINELSDILN